MAAERMGNGLKGMWDDVSRLARKPAVWGLGLAVGAEAAGRGAVGQLYENQPREAAVAVDVAAVTGLAYWLTLGIGWTCRHFDVSPNASRRLMFFGGPLLSLAAVRSIQHTEHPGGAEGNLTIPYVGDLGEINTIVAPAEVAALGASMAMSPGSDREAHAAPVAAQRQPVAVSR